MSPSILGNSVSSEEQRPSEDSWTPFPIYETGARGSLWGCGSLWVLGAFGDSFVHLIGSQPQ